jgi:hypothetical protein
MVAYVALGLLVLTIRSFDFSFGRMPDQIRRSTLVVDVAAVSAGAIAMASTAYAARAIMTWANVL